MINHLNRPHPTASCCLAVFCLAASACNLPAPPEAETPTAVLASPTAEPRTDCPPESLLAPDPNAFEAPISESLRPTFAWSYAGPCAPDGFRLEAAPDGDFTDPGTVVGTPAAGATSWTPDDDLRPATRYLWRVAATTSQEQGPYSTSQGFWTGPTCTGAGLQPPHLISPADGAYLDDPSPSLDFEYPTGACLQESFSLQVSADPDFATDALHATVGPATEFDTDVEYLADCTLYYWRVKAVYGMDISGPYSPAGAFYADFTGACAPHTGLPRLAGLVWLDHCDPAAPGTCVWQEGGQAPDGVRQDNEAALPGLLVRLAPGLCTSPDMGWTTGPTDADGRYAQFVLPDTYCVWIFRDRDGNQAILGSGRWTHPPGGYDSPVRYEIELDWGETRTDLDFGWYSRP